MNVSFLRWYVPEEDPIEKKKIFSMCYYGITGASLLLVVIVYFSSENLALVLLQDITYTPLFVIAGIILLTDALFHFPQILLQAQKKAFGYIGVVSLNVFLNLGFNYYFIVVKGFGSISVLYSLLISSIAAFIAVLPITIKNLTPYFSLAQYKKFFLFGVPYVANFLFVVLIDLSDRFLIERYLDSERVALYSANYKLGAAMAIIVNAFRLAWHPFFLSISNSEDAKRTFSRVFTYFLLFSCGIFLAISLFIDDLVRLDIGGFHLIAEDYWEGTFIIPWILLSYIVMGAYVVFSAGIHIEKITKFTPIFTGVGILTNIVANVILIPVIGIYGAAIATLIGYTVMTIIQYFTVQKYYFIQYEIARAVKILTAGALIFLVFKLYFINSGFIVKLLLLSSYPFILIVLRFYLKSEWSEIKGLTSKLIGKGNRN